jgi:hypothetical protein
VLRDPVTQKRFQDLGAEAAPDPSPAAFQSFIANDVEQWRDIVRSIDAKSDWPAGYPAAGHRPAREPYAQRQPALRRAA